MHVRVHVDKARCINVCSIYAHVDQTNDRENVIRKRECLFRDAFEYLASLSDAPTLLMGDFNTLVEDSEVLSGALSTGDWIDLAARFGKTDPTCSGKHGRRKDLVLANRTLAGLARGVSTPRSAPVAPHLPVQLNLGDWSSWAWTIHKPRAIPTSDQDRESDEAKGKAERAAEAVRQAVAGTDIDEHWKVVCDACENFLQGEANSDDQLQQGRGMPPQLERRDRMPPTSKGDVTADDIASRRRKSAAIDLRLLIGDVDALEGPGEVLRRLQLRWAKMRKTLARTLPGFGSTPEMPSLEALRTWHAQLLTVVAVEAAKTRAARRQAWADKLKRAMLRRDFRPVLEWCKGSSRRGLSHILTSGGALTADPQEVDEALWAASAWGGIFARYAEAEEPQWADFARRYSSAFPDQAQCEYESLTGEHLQATLRRMSGSKACGLDGWRVQS